VKRRRFQPQIVKDPLRRVTAFRHRRHHQVCAAHGIAAGKIFSWLV
jgi:hypothetical protein